MKRIFIFKVLLIFVLFISCTKKDGIIIIWENAEYLFPYKYEIKEQNASQRKWKKVPIEELFSITGIDDSLKFQPLRLREGNGSIFILDGANGIIKKFDMNGNFIKNFGGGFGNGPGEFTHPFDFDIDNNGNFYVVDIGKKSIISLNNEGKYRWQKLYKHNTPSLISVKDSTIIASVTGLRTNHIFELIHRDGQIISNYQSIVKRPDEVIDETVNVIGKPLLGKFAISEKKLIFIPTYIPQIIYYNLSGEIERAVSMIDKANNPILKFDKDNVHGLPGYFPTSFEGVEVNLGFSIVEGELINWSKIGNQEFGAHIFDVYDLNNGFYKYSFKLDLGPISDFSISGNNIFTINVVSTEFKGYKLNFN